jgi:hypothetical protein
MVQTKDGPALQQALADRAEDGMRKTPVELLLERQRV